MAEDHAIGSRVPNSRTGFGAVLETALGIALSKRDLNASAYREGVVDGLERALLLWDRWEADDE